MTAAHEIRHERFWDDRLTPSENKVTEMALNGMFVFEIAEEMDRSEVTVRKHLSLARKKGAPLPLRMPHRPHRDAVPIDRLVEARAQFMADGCPRWGLYRRIANRFGMNIATARVRLWKHDKKQKGASP